MGVQMIAPYYGGKSRIADKIIALMPPHKCYVEAFGGFAAVLMNKKPAPFTEVYNDLNEDCANLFRQLRDNAGPLHQLMRNTEYSRAVFAEAKQVLNDRGSSAVRRAWAFWVMHSLAIKSVQRGPGFGSGGVKYEGNKARTLRRRVENMQFVVERLRNIVIENRNALDLCRSFDHAHTLFYLDPPYSLTVRTSGKKYMEELGEAQHKELLGWAIEARGMILLSAYRNDMYDSQLLAAGWRVEEIATRTNAPGIADKVSVRKEAIYLNPNALSGSGLFKEKMILNK